MATAIPERIRLGDVAVVDVDAHLVESREVLASYCDAPWRTTLESHPHAPPFGRISRLFPNFPGQWQPRRFVATNAQDMCDDLAGLSIDIAVLFPETMLGAALIKPNDYAVAVGRAYNRWLVDQWVSRDSRLKGAVVAMPQDPDAAAREIEAYAGTSGVVGVFLPTAGVDPLWGDRRYDPIYEAAQAHDLPVLYHAGGTLAMPVLPFQPAQLDTWFQSHTYSHSIAIMGNLVHLLSTGVPVRFPRLKLAFIEAAVAWFPHLMYRMDRVFEDSRWDLPILEEKPSYYLKRQMYVATQPVEEPEDPRELAALIRLAGEDRVLFASDYPHHDFDHPRKVFDAPIGSAAKRKIMGENAADLFKISLPRKSRA